MKKTLVVNRSPEWIANQRLITGENTPEEIDVEFDIAALSIEGRKVLLEFGNGVYPMSAKLYFGDDLRPNQCSNYGRLKIFVDNINPTVSQIDTALCNAYKELNAQREQEEADRKAKADQKAAADKAMADARELLKDEIERKDARIKYLEGELAEAREKIAEMA